MKKCNRCGHAPEEHNLPPDNNAKAPPCGPLADHLRTFCACPGYLSRAVDDAPAFNKRDGIKVEG